MRTNVPAALRLWGLMIAVLAIGTRAEALDLFRAPYLQNTTETSVTVMWGTDLPADSTVEYGPTTDFEYSVTRTGSVLIHEVVIRDLEPATTYHYRVRSGGLLLGEPSTFRTANPAGSDDPFDFVVFGDSGMPNQVQWDEAALIEDIMPTFVVHTGDILQTNGHSPEDWNAKFFDMYGPFIDQIPFFPCIGNHEYYRDNATSVRQVFANPANNPERSEKYYSFDYGDAHFVVLDTEEDFLPGSPQYLFLVDQLKNHRRKWNFVISHYYAYNSGGSGGFEEVRRYLAPIYEAYGVDIVFNGHKHNYERFKPITESKIDEHNGVVYIITGGGGAPLGNVYPTDLTAASEKSHHFTHISIEGDTLRGQSIRSDGRQIDSFERTARVGDATVIDPNDLLVHLPFDECGGDEVRDLSPYGHHGFLGTTEGPDAADPAWDPTQRQTGCGSLYFDGDTGPKCVTVPDRANLLDPDEGFTLSCWVRYATTDNWSTLISGGEYRYALYLSSGGSLEGYFVSLQPNKTGKTPQGVPSGVWNHVAMVFDSGDARFYLNGELHMTTRTQGTFNDDIDALTIGWDGFVGDEFTGWIDEVQIFGRPLTRAELNRRRLDAFQDLVYPDPDPIDPPGPLPIEPADLICQLSFDEEDGQIALDGSGRGNNGVFGTDVSQESSDPARTPYAKFGAGAIQLDGVDDRITVFDSNSDLDLDQEWTTMAWIRFDGVSPWSPIVCGGTYQYATYLNGQAQVRAYLAGFSPANQGDTAEALAPGEWHHVALARTQGSLTTYLNGVPVRVTAVAGSISSVSVFYVGHDGHPGDFFAGTIDEVKIYRRGLSPADVLAEMNATFGEPYALPDPPEEPPTPPTTVPEDSILHLPFEDGAGQQASDESGNSRHGTLGSSTGDDSRDPVWTDAGRNASNALDFGADRYVAVANADNAFDLSESFTISAWIRYDAVDNWSAVACGGEYTYGLYLMSGGRVRAYFDNLSPRATPATAVTIAPGTWAHVALVKSGAQVQIFVDGVAAGTSRHEGAIAPVSVFRVGFDGFSGDGFDGRIDDVRVYDRALSNDEVAALAESS